MAGAVGIEPTLPGWPVSATLPKLTPEMGDLSNTPKLTGLYALTPSSSDL